MLRKFDYIISSLILVLGIVHASMTPVFFPQFNLPAIWFAGAGLAFLFLGIINFIRLRSKDAFISITSLLSNVIGLLFCILIVLFLAEPQAYVSLICLVLVVIFSLIGYLKK